MSFILALFLAIFWLGIAMMIMSASGMIAIPVLSIFIPWIVILGVGITIFFLIIHGLSKYDDLEQFHAFEQRLRENESNKNSKK